MTAHLTNPNLPKTVMCSPSTQPAGLSPGSSVRIQQWFHHPPACQDDRIPDWFNLCNRETRKESAEGIHLSGPTQFFQSPLIKGDTWKMLLKGKHYRELGKHFGRVVFADADVWLRSIWRVWSIAWQGPVCTSGKNSAFTGCCHLFSSVCAGVHTRVYQNVLV